MKRNEYTPLNFIEKRNTRISLLASIAVLIFLVLLFFRLDYTLVQRPAAEKNKPQSERKLTEAETETDADAETETGTKEVSTATVIAVGDNLYHGSLLEHGKRDSEPWNYEDIYANVKDVVQASDLAIIDQETVLTTDHDSISSYPKFATPTEVGDALVATGFDVMESSTNHIDDMGYEFIEQTINFWRDSHPEVTVVGIHDSEEDAQQIKVREVNGIKIAILNYTYGTNLAGQGAGEGREYAFDMFSQGSERIASMVKKAKKQADCVIFIASWGNEDETMPTEYEKQWATFLMQQGVDVLIGGHPHVLQPYGRMTDDQGHEMAIFYSLGNFVSTQRELPELLGGMASFTLQKTVANGKTSIQVLDQTVKPTVMHYNVNDNIFSVYMLEDYTDELARQHGVREYIGDIFTVSNLKRKFDEIMAMKVTPSSNTSMLNVRFDYDGNMIDINTGDLVEDNASISYWTYYGNLGIDISNYEGDGY